MMDHFTLFVLTGKGGKSSKTESMCGLFIAHLHGGNISKMQFVPSIYSLVGGRQIIRVHYNENIP